MVRATAHSSSIGLASSDGLAVSLDKRWVSELSAFFFLAQKAGGFTFKVQETPTMPPMVFVWF